MPTRPPSPAAEAPTAGAAWTAGPEGEGSVRGSGTPGPAADPRRRDPGDAPAAPLATPPPPSAAPEPEPTSAPTAADSGPAPRPDTDDRDGRNGTGAPPSPGTAATGAPGTAGTTAARAPEGAEAGTGSGRAAAAPDGERRGDPRLPPAPSRPEAAGAPSAAPDGRREEAAGGAPVPPPVASGYAPTEPDFTLPPALLADPDGSPGSAARPGTTDAPDPAEAADPDPSDALDSPDAPGEAEEPEPAADAPVSYLSVLAQAAPGLPAPGDAPAPVPAAPWPPVPGTPDPRVRDDGSDDGAPVPGAPSADTEALPEPEAGPRCVACDTGTVDEDGYCGHCGHKQPLDRDHWEHETSGVAAASDRGLRHHRNEDFFAVASTALPNAAPASIAVVCDGVSSAERSDEASTAAAEAASRSLCEALPRGVHTQQAMHNALVAAADAVSALATDEDKDPQRNAPACTIVSAVIADGILTVGWIGDSRAYWVPQDRTAHAARLTEDDSWAAQMVAAGLMNEAEAYADARAHAITGWLGADAYELDPHTASFKPDRAGVVVVCTDGLWNYAESAEEMAAAVPSDAYHRPLQSAWHLVGYALDGGGHDNITVAVVPFPPPSVGA